MSYSLLYPQSASSNHTNNDLKASENKTLSLTFDRYLEAEVMSADPVKLTAMLFRGSLDAVQTARRALAGRDIALRSRQIVKAWDIVRELDTSLNPEAGGNLSKQLKELYVYMGQRLIEANTEQSDAKLSEVESILTLLAEAWRQVPPIGVTPANPAAYSEPEYRPVSHAW